MKKYGFTLIELLAVIVILAIISLIAVPIVINIINDSKKSSQKESINLYGDAIRNAIANYQLKNIENKNLNLKDLEAAKLINYKGSKIECETTQIWKNKDVYLADCTIDGEKVDYTYGKLHIEEPKLDNGLTPVIYVDESTEENPTAGYWKVPEKNEEWYDYSNQKWANAVVLGKDDNGNDIVKNPGDHVAVDGTEAKMMLVWIPRYEYKYKKLEANMTYNQKQTPPGIDINFIPKNQTSISSSDYKVHPAFKFGEQELGGIWVGKFELSQPNVNSNYGDSLNCINSSCNFRCTMACDNYISGLIVLPNFSSLKNNGISTYFYAIRKIENEQSFKLSKIDTHMMKNSEWGAVAYLSQSKYGKYGNSDYTGVNKEVYQNKSRSYITGSSNGTPSTSDSNVRNPQCIYSDMTSMGTGKGICGPGASTTGNIYGIYDMSGGVEEATMGIYGDSKDKIYSGVLNSSRTGFNGWTFSSEYSDASLYEYTGGDPMPEAKYYNLYTSTNITKACNNDVCYGHALSETDRWYSDNNFSKIEPKYPIYLRGGASYHNVPYANTWGDSGAGLYTFNRFNFKNPTTTRVVFTEK